MTGLRWSRRTTTTIAQELATLGFAVSPNTVARLLHDIGYSLRVNQKQISTSRSPQRNLQFEYLAEFRHRFQRRHLPIISVDTKKRGLVGNFKNPGQRWELAPRCVYDHDFRTDSSGVAIPYGIYDVRENCGTLVVGISMAPPPLPLMPSLIGGTRKVPLVIAVHASYSSLPIPAAVTLARCYAWKTEVQWQVANSFALAVTVAHYPTGASKWNPIVYFLKSRETGLANHWTPSTKSSTMPALLKPKPDFASLHTSTVAIILVALNPHPIKLLLSAYNTTKPCPSGITPLSPN